MAIYCVGVDVGSVRDRYAVSVVRRDRDRFGLVHVDATRKVSMDEVTRSVFAMVVALDGSLPARDRILVALDRGGMGLGVAETLEKMLRTAHRDRRLTRWVKFVGVQSTGGDGVKVDDDDRWKVNVGRDALVIPTTMAIREGRLNIRDAKGDAAAMLGEELAGLDVTTTRAGKARVDHKPGHHDDVFMATCLAFWLVSRTGVGGTVASNMARILSKPLEAAHRAVKGREDPEPKQESRTPREVHDDAVREAVTTGQDVRVTVTLNGTTYDRLYLAGVPGSFIDVSPPTRVNGQNLPGWGRRIG